jgi:hypothetical protein
VPRAPRVRGLQASELLQARLYALLAGFGVAFVVAEPGFDALGDVRTAYWREVGGFSEEMPEEVPRGDGGSW